MVEQERCRRRTLSNGLRVVEVETPSRHFAHVSLYVKMGPRYETLAENGISHFLEHMLFLGSREYDSAEEISRRLWELNADYNGATDNEYAVLSLDCYYKNLPQALHVFADTILHPLLREESIEQERHVISSELAEDQDQHGRSLNGLELARELLWPDKGFSFHVVGTRENILRFRRADLVAHYDRVFRPDNMVLALSGNFMFPGLYEVIEECFGARSGASSVAPQPLNGGTVGPQALFRNTTGMSASLRLSHRASSYRDPMLYPLRAASAMLGGGPASRLFIVLREECNLTYDVGSDASAYADAGTLDVMLNAVPDDLDEAIGLLLDIVYDFASNGPTDQEMAAFRRRLTPSLELSLDDPVFVASFIAVKKLLLNSERSLTPWDDVAELSRVTADEIALAVRSVIRPDRRALVVLGPVGSPQRRRLRELIARQK